MDRYTCFGALNKETSKISSSSPYFFRDELMRSSVSSEISTPVPLVVVTLCGDGQRKQKAQD